MNTKSQRKTKYFPHNKMKIFPVEQISMKQWRQVKGQKK